VTSGATVSSAGVQEIGRGGKAVGATLVSGGHRSSRPAASPVARRYPPAAFWKSTAAARPSASRSSAAACRSFRGAVSRAEHS
jgi:autotransporter passenger strand-loop-strand repeat protein